MHSWKIDLFRFAGFMLFFPWSWLILWLTVNFCQIKSTFVNFRQNCLWSCSSNVNLSRIFQFLLQHFESDRYFWVIIWFLFDSFDNLEWFFEIVLSNFLFSTFYDRLFHQSLHFTFLNWVIDIFGFELLTHFNFVLNQFIETCLFLLLDFILPFFRKFDSFISQIIFLVLKKISWYLSLKLIVKRTTFCLYLMRNSLLYLQFDFTETFNILVWVLKINRFNHIELVSFYYC